MFFTLFMVDDTILYDPSTARRIPASFSLWSGGFAFLQSSLSYTHTGKFKPFIFGYLLENLCIFTR